MSKVSVHGPHYPTPLIEALQDNVKNLIGLGVPDHNAYLVHAHALALESNDSPWLRHAVLCLLLDITDAEVRALNRNSSPTSVSAVATRSHSEVTEEPAVRADEEEAMEYDDSDTSLSISVSQTPEGGAYQ